MVLIRGRYIKRYLNINILSVQNFKNLIFEILKFHFKHQELENHSCKVYINLVIILESLLNRYRFIEFVNLTVFEIFWFEGSL